jgi:hypothetical protein
MTTTIIPAAPGFYAVRFVVHDRAVESYEYVPIIAWQIEQDGAGGVIRVTPVWAESMSEMEKQNPWIRYPDGRIAVGPNVYAGTIEEYKQGYEEQLQRLAPI